MADNQNEQILQAIKELNDQMNEGFRKVDERLEKMDRRFDEVEARQEKMQNGFDILVKREMDNEADNIGFKKTMGQK